MFNASTFTPEGILHLLISFLILAFSLSVHECAHGYMAHLLGDDTALEQGRLTLNPLAHLDLIGTLLMLSGLVGWAKPVPFNPRRFRPSVSIKKGIVLVAVAGPLSNLLLSAIAYILLNLTILLVKGLGMHASFIPLLLYFLSRMSLLNVFLAVFNSLPVPPLDGYKVFGAILPAERYFRIMRVERQIGLAFLAFILLFPGLLNRILQTVATPFLFLIYQPIDWLFSFF